MADPVYSPMGSSCGLKGVDSGATISRGGTESAIGADNTMVDSTWWRRRTQDGDQQ